MVPKTPAFPLYGKDAYDDELFSRLSFAAQGFYWFLAWWQWSEGSIPADLERVLDKIPRTKLRESRRVWLDVEPLFPVTSDDPSRRANETVERHRSKLCGDRDRRKAGAEITNRKRWGAPASLSLSDSLSDTSSDSLRAASANASDLKGESRDQPGRVQGGVVTPDFEAIRRAVEKLDASALQEHPPDQIVAAWFSDGIDGVLIEETLVDCENEYRGKHWRYLEKILKSRRDNPDQRPKNRRARSGNGNGNDDGNRGGERPGRRKPPINFA